MDGEVYVFWPFHQLQLPHGNIISVNSPDISLFVTPQVNDMRKSPGVFAFRGTQGRRQNHFPRLLGFSKHSRKTTGAVRALPPHAYFTENNFRLFPNDGPGETQNVAQKRENVPSPHLGRWGGTQKRHSTTENVTRPVPHYRR